MNSQRLEELLVEVTVVLEVQSPVIKRIELTKKQYALQRPTDSLQQLRANRAFPFEVHLQDGLIVAGLGLHLRPPR